MGSFLYHNKQKLAFAYRFIALLFLTCCFILLSLAYFSGQFPDAQLLIIIVATAGFIFPAFVLIIVWLGWELKKYRFNKLLQYLSFATQQDDGYTVKRFNHESKWFFTEEIMTKTIDSYEVLLTMENNGLQFAILTARANAAGTSADFLSKIKNLGITEIGYNDYGITLSKKQTKTISYGTIEKKLIALVTLFKQYGFEPL